MKSNGTGKRVFEISPERSPEKSLETSPRGFLNDKDEEGPMSAKNARELGLRSCRETVPAKPSAAAADSSAENAQ